MGNTYVLTREDVLIRTVGALRKRVYQLDSRNPLADCYIIPDGNFFRIQNTNGKFLPKKYLTFESALSDYCGMLIQEEKRVPKRALHNLESQARAMELLLHATIGWPLQLNSQ